VDGRRYQPRRRWPAVAAVVLAALIAVRIWQTARDPSVEEPIAEGRYDVQNVIDGDTIVLAGGAHIRLIGVDTPETRYSKRSDGADQPLAIEAKEFTERAVGGGKVRLGFDKERIDPHGRYLAYVWYNDPSGEDELLLNEELIRAGFTPGKLHYFYSDRMKRRFRAAEVEARHARRGIWADE
jgi:micrococcal nuclease